jgi:hypothetical protein
MAAKKKSARKYGKAASKSVKSALHRKKSGTLKSGAGAHGKVKSRKQAIAIGLSEARAKGAKVPKKRAAKKTGAKKSAAKKSTAKKSAAKKSSRKKSAS